MIHRLRDLRLAQRPIVIAVVDVACVGLIARRSGPHTAIVIEDGLTWRQLSEAAQRCLTANERSSIRQALGLPALPHPLPDLDGVARMPELRTATVAIVHLVLDVDHATWRQPA